MCQRSNTNAEVKNEIIAIRCSHKFFLQARIFLGVTTLQDARNTGMLEPSLPSTG